MVQQKGALNGSTRSTSHYSRSAGKNGDALWLSRSSGVGNTRRIENQQGVSAQVKVTS